MTLCTMFVCLISLLRYGDWSALPSKDNVVVTKYQKLFQKQYLTPKRTAPILFSMYYEAS